MYVSPINVMHVLQIKATCQSTYTAFEMPLESSCHKRVTLHD